MSRVERSEPPVRALRAAFLDLARVNPGDTWARRCGLARTERTRDESRALVLDTEAALARLGLRPGVLVGLRVPNGPAFCEALFAAWGAGLCPVLFDATMPEPERVRVEERIGIGWRWDVDDPFALDLGVPRPGAADWSDLRDAGAHPSASVLKLTSGSTGAPRGIAVSDRALADDSTRLIRAMGLRADDRLLVAIPLAHSYGFSVLVGPAALAGASLCFPGEADTLAAARELDATFLPSVPAWFRATLGHAGSAALPPDLRLFLSAGAPLAADVARGFRERFGRPIHVLYGASECGGIAYDGDGSATERGGVGTLLPGVDVELEPTDDSAGRGEGRVRVRSSSVADHYVPARPEDAARLGGGVYRSEDVARLERDELFLIGRTSDWIDVRGKKVDPREVERVVSEMQGVEEVAVLGAPHGSEQRLCAFVATPDATLRGVDVLRWCAARLSPHKRPRAVHLLEQLPRTGRGKLDRARLLALSGAPPRQDPTASPHAAAPPLPRDTP